MHAIEYRPEVDGLRAVAILPVLLFHLGFSWIPGGYLGVDVFFVISGFLITSILIREMAEGRFSFRRFWSRRIRRIVPALLVVTAATVAATWVFVFPPDRPAIGRQAVASLLSFANFYFWRHANNYWGPQAEDSPFLHAWSLAVEEQFYILFPGVIFVLIRRGSRWLTCGLLAILVGSLFLFMLGVHARPSATFYLLPTRAWELATGGLVAATLHGRGPSDVSPGISAAFATAGLCATLASFGLVSEFSAWALVPVIGAALVIGFGRHGVVNRILSQPAVVKVGKISYSLYLWHWPVIVLSRHLEYTVPSSVLVLLTWLLSVVSYHLVEEPLRRRPMVIPGIAGGFICVLATAAALCLLPAPRYDVSEFAVSQTYSLYFDINPHRQAGGDLPEMFAGMDATAPIASPNAFRDEGIVIGPGDGPPKVVVLGDSHGLMWAHAIQVAAQEAGMKTAFYCIGGLDPFMDVPPQRCQTVRKLSPEEKYDYDIARIRSIEQWKPEVVVICARWAVIKPGSPEPLVGFLQRQSARVVFIEQPPELAGVGDHSAAQFAAFRGIRPKAGVKQYWKAGNVEAYEAGRALLQSLTARYPNCEIVPTRDLFVEGQGVWFLDGATLLYVDDDHLTTQGSLMALPRIRKSLSPKRASPSLAE